MEQLVVQTFYFHFEKSLGEIRLSASFIIVWIFLKVVIDLS